MKEREPRKQKMLAFLLLGIPPVVLLTALLSVILLWEPHSTEAGEREISIGEMELNTSVAQEGMEPQRREEALAANMTLEEKAAQLFVITPEALTGVNQVSAAGEMTREAFFQYPVGGILYSGENLQTENQTVSLLSDMQKISMERLGVPVFLGIEGEGENKVSIAGYGSFDMTELGFNLDLTQVADLFAEENGEGTAFVIVEQDTREAAVDALLAGADLICMQENFKEAYQGVLDAVNDGTLTEERIEESVKKILRLKSKISG